jgi:hypothetical protein
VIALAEISNNDNHVLTVGNVSLPLKRDSLGFVEVMVKLVWCIGVASGNEFNGI